MTPLAIPDPFDGGEFCAYETASILTFKPIVENNISRGSSQWGTVRKAFVVAEECLLIAQAKTAHCGYTSCLKHILQPSARV